MSTTNRITPFLDETYLKVPRPAAVDPPFLVEREDPNADDPAHDPDQCLYCWAREQDQTFGPVLVTDVLAEMASQSDVVRDSVHTSWAAFCARDWGACSPSGLEINDASYIDGGMVLGVYPFGMFKIAILAAPKRRVVSISLFQEAESAAIAATMATRASGAQVIRMPIDEFRRRL